MNSMSEMYRSMADGLENNLKQVQEYVKNLQSAHGEEVQNPNLIKLTEQVNRIQAELKAKINQDMGEIAAIDDKIDEEESIES